jgi:hypothetical protein
VNAVRRDAIDRECQIRLEGCTGGPCCRCHFRMSGISGMGMKSPDWLSAWGCAHCHAIVDSLDRDDYRTRLDFALAVFRTLYIADREGRLTLTA